MFVVLQAPADPEVAPLILESEYFPRPSGYDGYCLLGQEEEPGDSQALLLEAAAGLLVSSSIEIEHFSSPEADTETPTNFPKGILTPDRNRRHQREASLKSVSFNPRTEFKFLEEQ